MKIKYLFFFTSLLFINTLIAQESNVSYPKTKAIIIGVSEYPNLPSSLQLNYADSDAQLIYDFLVSTPNIDSSDVTLLLNERASNAMEILVIIQQLLIEASPNERFIIYFAGHGDVQNTISQDEGFLLLSNISLNEGYYKQASALNINMLQYYTKLGDAKGIKIFLITDACRSGMVISEEGATSALTAFQTPWENTTKFVSCKASESSWEFTSLGSGHGVFTYYLVLGMMGLADENNDNKIFAEELYNYVSNKVTNRTKNYQNPVISNKDSTFYIKVYNEIKDNAIEKDRLNKSKKKNNKQRGFFKTNFLIPNSLNLIDSFYSVLNTNYLLDPILFVKDKKTNIEIQTSKKHLLKQQTTSKLNVFDNERLMAIVTKENLIKILSIDTLSTIFFLNQQKLLQKKHKDDITELAISPDNKYLASSSMDNSIILWNIQEQKGILKLKKVHKYYAKDLVFSPTGKYILSIGKNSELKIWDIQQKKLLKTIDSIKIDKIYFNIDSSKMFTINYESNEIAVWNSKTFELINILKEHTQDLKSIVFSQTHNLFCSISESGELIIWNTETFKVINSFDLEIRIKNEIEFYNKYILIPDKKQIIFFDFTTKKIQNVEFGNKKSINSMYFFSNNSEIIFNYKKGISKAEIIFPELLPSATYLYEQIISEPDLKQYHELCKGKLFLAYQNKTQELINSIYREYEQKPTLEEIEKGIRMSENAFQLYADNQLFSSLALKHKLILQSHKIISTNDVQNYTNAVDYLKQLLIIEQYSAYPYISLSIIYQKMNKPELADSVINIAIQRVPNWTEAKKNYGQLLLSQSEYEKALVEFQKIIEIQPDVTYSYNNIGDIYTGLGSFKSAEEYYQKSLQIDSLNSNTYSKYGNLQMQRGRLNEAEELLNKSISLDSANTYYFLIMGDYYFHLYKNIWHETNLIKYAEESYKKAIVHDSYNPEVYLKLSQFYTNILKLEENDILKVLSLDFYTYRTPPKTEKEIILDEIILLNQKALQLNPFTPDASIGLAYVATMYDNPELAKTYYTKAIEQKPLHPKPYYNYAKYFEDQNNYPKAIFYYKAAIEKDEKYLLAYASLWDLYKETEAVKQLDSLFNIVKNIFPDSPIFFYKNAVRNKNKSNIEYNNKALKKDDKYILAEISKQTYTFLNYNNTPIIEVSGLGFDFKYIKKLDDTHIIVRARKKFGVINIAGEICVPFDYYNIFPINDTLICALKKNSENNTVIYWMSYDGLLYNIKEFFQVEYLDTEFFKVNDWNYKYGCLDKFGNIIVNLEYQSIEPFHKKHKLIAIRKNNKYGCVNLKGEEIIDIKYDKIRPLSKNGVHGCRCFIGEKQFDFNSYGNPI